MATKKVIDIVKKSDKSAGTESPLKEFAVKKPVVKESVKFEDKIVKEEPAQENVKGKMEKGESETLIEKMPATEAAPAIIDKNKPSKTEILENIIQKETSKTWPNQMMRPEYQKKEEKESAKPQDSKNYQAPKERKKHSFVFYSLIVIIIALLGVSVYAAINILPRADITLTSKKVQNWTYQNPITGNPQISSVDVDNRQIPSAILTQKKNLSVPWPATGQKYVSRSATGNITIYNNYSSAPQTLVAGTRFQAPDGKIFKLDSKVTVPGAQVSGGQVSASSVQATVTADAPGDAYNIGAISRFTIPGFAGSDKYSKFYGSSSDAMSGGFIGNTAYPTADDIAKAKAAAEAQIQSAVKGLLYAELSSETLKVMDGTENFAVTKETVNDATDSSGKFSIYIEGTDSVQTFRESDVIDLVTALGIQANGSDFALQKTDSLTYGTSTVAVKTNLATFQINFVGDFWKPIDVNDFKNQILGKSENDLKALIFSSSKIEKADISFWPFWVNVVPSDPKRVNVTVQ